MRIEDTPFHVTGLEKFVELEQAQDFTGKAALARLAQSGVDRKLVGIDIGDTPMSDEGALNDFWPVRASGHAPIGRVTAAAWSPRLERNVGFAWVPSSHMAEGTALEIDAPQGARPATVVPLPFVDPKKHIPKG
jgi:glycine cleavage system aminomethyltransferase T